MGGDVVYATGLGYSQQLVLTDIYAPVNVISNSLY